MTRFKLNFGMTLTDDDRTGRRVNTPKAVVDPDVQETSKSSMTSRSSSSISSKLLFRANFKTIMVSSMMKDHSRDIPVTESCKTRRVIEPDKQSFEHYFNRTTPSPINTNNSKLNINFNDRASSSYKFWTELTTTLVLWLLMITMSAISRIFQHRHRYNYKPYSVNYFPSSPLKFKSRISSKNSCIRSFNISATLFLLSCSTSWRTVHGQPPPPPLPPAGFLDFDNLPVTRFSCEGKVIGGYYADVETGCQMFHVCTLGQKDEIQDIKFLCLNGTVFDQETRVCERVDEVDCSKAEQFFDLNLDLYVSHATTQKPEADLEEEDDVIRPVHSSSSSNKKSVPSSTTRSTTTTTTPTPSPRTRPPSLTPKSGSPPVVSGGSSNSQRHSSSEQEDEDQDDRRRNNAYTSFNYYLKTPHAHVESGYNSQSRQSYIINQPTSKRDRERERGTVSGPTGSSSSNNPVAATSSTGRKVPSGSGSKTVVYSSTSTSSSSTQRPKTVVVVKATLPPSKSILKPKTLATPRTIATTTTQAPPPKYDLDDQYDEYYDDEDYPLEPAQPQSQQQQLSQSKSNTFYQQSSYPVSKALNNNNGYDFRDGRSTKGEANAGQTLVSSTTGRSPSSNSRGKTSIVVSSAPVKATSKPVLVSPASIKVISSEFISNNSTEEPYYYEDDYPDDATLQQQQQDQLRQVGYSSTSASLPSASSSSRGKLTASNSRGNSPVSTVPLEKSASLGQSNTKSRTDIIRNNNKQKEVSSLAVSADSSDYYDDDAENVNAHDHHFTHVDVPRIPFAKPNVPRVLVTNGKPFLPRLRRQSHHHNYHSSVFPIPPPQRRQSFLQDFPYSLPPEEHSALRRRPSQSQLFPQNSFHNPSYQPHHFYAQPQQRHQLMDSRHAYNANPAHSTQSNFRQEVRAKPIEWGRDPLPFR